MIATKDVGKNGCGICLQYSTCFALILCCMLCGCSTNSCILEPSITYIPQAKRVECLPSPFEDLSATEKRQAWGKELYIGTALAREMDLYRAITAFKRALILIPRDQEDRRLQIHYCIMESYYLGCKYQDAVDAFETSPLYGAPCTFPAYDDMLIIAYDSYMQIDQEEKAARIYKLIETRDPEKAGDLALSESILNGDFCGIDEFACTHPASDNLENFLCEYSQQSKSVLKAQTLNAVLPGAGYLYVGQQKSALTSFLINTLFIAAAYQFFDHGYPAAGLITTSLELGWYLGGINGAGLAAKEYNQRMYESLGKEVMICNHLFPVLMLEKSF